MQFLFLCGVGRLVRLLEEQLYHVLHLLRLAEELDKPEQSCETETGQGLLVILEHFGLVDGEGVRIVGWNPVVHLPELGVVGQHLVGEVEVVGELGGEQLGHPALPVHWPGPGRPPPRPHRPAHQETDRQPGGRHQPRPRSQHRHLGLAQPGLPEEAAL